MVPSERLLGEESNLAGWAGGELYLEMSCRGRLGGREQIHGSRNVLARDPPKNSVCARRWVLGRRVARKVTVRRQSVVSHDAVLTPHVSRRTNSCPAWSDANALLVPLDKRQVAICPEPSEVLSRRHRYGQPCERGRFNAK